MAPLWRLTCVLPYWRIVDATVLRSRASGAPEVVVQKHIDLNLLPIVIAHDELNASRAARRLGMTQPAVSKALRRLREAFDDPY